MDEGGDILAMGVGGLGGEFRRRWLLDASTSSFGTVFDLPMVFTGTPQICYLDKLI